jgi:hypothetical protein
LRWVALGWLLLWAPAYAWGYDLANFLAFCDVAVVLTCIGLWTGSALLLSSQAVSSIVVDLAWVLDLVWRLATGEHLIGGTEYMWDDRFALPLRLLSLFHLAWPPLLLLALRRTGYDGRGLLLQAGIATVLLVLARLLSTPEENLNFAWRDPFLKRPLGPAPVHMALILGGLVGLVYWPTHLALRRLLPPAKTP